MVQKQNKLLEGSLCILMQNINNRRNTFSYQETILFTTDENYNEEEKKNPCISAIWLRQTVPLLHLR